MTTTFAANLVTGITLGAVTISAANIPAPVNDTNCIDSCRGLFMLEINDVAAASIMRFFIIGGLSVKPGDPSGFYTFSAEPYSDNTTVVNPGGPPIAAVAQTIVVTNTATTTEYELIYTTFTNGGTTQADNCPTINYTGNGAAPAGNTIITTRQFVFPPLN